MRKRGKFTDNRQLALDLHQPKSNDRDGILAGLDKRLSSAVSHILDRDSRSRYEIAGEVSRLLDDEVSKGMLDKYTSPSADTHNISAARFLALISATGAYDILREFVLEIGADLVVGDEVLTAELGSIEAEIAQLIERKKSLKKLAPPSIERLGRGGR